MLTSPFGGALAREHRRDLLETAARDRLVRLGRAGVSARARARVGRTLITTGLRLVGGGYRPEELRRLALPAR